MIPSRFVRTTKFEIVLQVTETEPAAADSQEWLVHDVERNRGFRVTLAPQVAAGGRAAGGGPTPEQIDTALGMAIERALVTPPEKVGGQVYDVTVTLADLEAARDLGHG